MSTYDSYRSKTVYVEAIQLSDINHDEVLAFVPELSHVGFNSEGFRLNVGGGVYATVRPGDWILKLHGRCWYESDSVFQSNWEPAAEGIVGALNRIADVLERFPHC